jgi:hypothetical protein
MVFPAASFGVRFAAVQRPRLLHRRARVGPPAAFVFETIPQGRDLGMNRFRRRCQ